MHEIASVNLLNSALLNTNPVSLLPASVGSKTSVPAISFAEVAAVEQIRAVEKQQGDAALTESLSGQDPIEEFKKYMQMSPAEKMLYSVLADAGITIEEYNELPAEEKAKLDEKVTERLREDPETRQLSGSQAHGIAQYQLMHMNATEKDSNRRLADIFV